MNTMWATHAREAMEELIEAGEPFTADDLCDMAGQPDRDHRPNSRNSGIGSLFSEYSKAKRIVPVGVEKSRAPHRKGGMIRVWRAS